MEEKRKILVIGDLMLDRRIKGVTERISPEAPCPVVRSQQIIETPGGAGNLAANAATLYGHVRVVGSVGKDPAGQRVCDMLVQDYGCQLRTATPTDRSGTVVKTRVTCLGQQMIRVDEESGSLASDAELINALASVLHTKTDVGVVAVGDYNKGTMSPAVIEWLMTACTNLGIPTFIDTKPSRVGLYKHAWLLKVNLAEIVEMGANSVLVAMATGISDHVDQAIAGATWVQQQHGFQYVVVTLGSEGAVYLTPEGESRHIPVYAQHVFDVTGAGDTFMAALASSCIQGIGLHESVWRANLAAGLAVQEHGVVTVNADRLLDEILAETGWQGKIMSMPSALAYVDRQRRQGRKIVFTNGCFDLLHPGHIHIIRQARLLGDILVVAYNSDRTIHLLKGEGRPKIPSQQRAEMLAQLDAVDCVVEFDDESVENTVHRFKPDVLVKGGEYRDTVVPGAEFVARHGGTLRLIPMLPGFSTTGLQK